MGVYLRYTHLAPSQPRIANPAIRDPEFRANLPCFRTWVSGGRCIARFSAIGAGYWEIKIH